MTPRSHATLKRQYRYFNRKFFDSQLPTDIEIVWAPLDNAHGKAWPFLKIVYMDPPLMSTINARALVLLHEMCHIRHPRAGHGRVFKSCLQMLWDKGAIQKFL